MESPHVCPTWTFSKWGCLKFPWPLLACIISGHPLNTSLASTFSLSVSSFLFLSCVSAFRFSSQQAAVLTRFCQNCVSSDIPVISVTVWPLALVQRVVLLDFSNILRSSCFLLLLYPSLLSTCLFSSLTVSIILSLSLSLSSDCLSASLPLTVNRPSVWSSDRKSLYVFTFCWDTHMYSVHTH